VIRETIGASIVWTIRRIFGLVERATGEEPRPLLDNHPQRCSSGCTAERVIEGCPIHTEVKP